MLRSCATALLCCITGLAAASAPAESETPSSQPAAAESRQFTFSWPFQPDAAMRPRGGTTTGTEVTLQSEPSGAWQRLTGAGLAPLERDRQAILAMAGAYRTSFDFIETIGFTPGYQPTRPYQSWGTEYVYVIADEPAFISLQHILVMHVEGSNAPSEPIVVKHWRQDWRYQDRNLHVYVGEDTWQRRRLPEDQVQGTWSQAVYQVDDSPRYQAIGRWQHHPNHSTWTSGDTWRPLPRREFSVRDDYDVLDGTNRVTILPSGWVHEEDNLKLVLDGTGEPAAGTPYLAREAGLNRYEHIVDFDFSAGARYWDRTAPFWAQVRAAWGDIYQQHDRFTLREEVDGARMFEVMFAMAESFEPEQADLEAVRSKVAETLARFIEQRH